MLARADGRIAARFWRYNDAIALARLQYGMARENKSHYSAVEQCRVAAHQYREALRGSSAYHQWAAVLTRGCCR